MYPENWSDPNKRGTLINKDQDDINRSRGVALNTVAMLPYLDTGDDILVATTGCGYACQAGYDVEAGWFWRGVAYAGIILPFGSTAARHGTEAALDIARKMGDNIPVGQGFKSFYRVKKYLGFAGEGIEWHHIVEQSQIRKSGFSPYSIHNTGNMIAVDAATHRKISGFYNSGIAGPGTTRGRNWLAGQSYEFQYNFGIQALRDFNVIP